MGNKSNSDTITINKKALFWAFPLFPIVGILLSRNDPAFILVIIGTVCGYFLGKNLEKVKK
jgi:hypothetical protein